MDYEMLLRYLTILARFLNCLLASVLLEPACLTIYKAIKTRALPKIKVTEKYKHTLYVLVVSVGFLMYHNHKLFEEDFVILLMAYTLVRYLELKHQPAIITYGEALACSYSEGYLYQVIPGDGPDIPSLEHQIQTMENRDHVVFPVRKLLVVITKSLFCPPNLEAYNKNNLDLPSVEACKSLPDVRRHVAGVLDRVYRNTAYKIKRHGNDPRPVYIVAGSALNTLHKVLQKRAVYQCLAAADGDEIMASFCATLPRIVASSPELRGHCDLVFYDDTNPDENIAEVLLAKVRELEPNFENIIRARG